MNCSHMPAKRSHSQKSPWNAKIRRIVDRDRIKHSSALIARPDVADREFAIYRIEWKTRYDQWRPARSANIHLLQKTISEKRDKNVSRLITFLITISFSLSLFFFAFSANSSKFRISIRREKYLNFSGESWNTSGLIREGGKREGFSGVRVERRNRSLRAGTWLRSVRQSEIRI